MPGEGGGGIPGASIVIGEMVSLFKKSKDDDRLESEKGRGRIVAGVGFVPYTVDELIAQGKKRTTVLPTRAAVLWEDLFDAQQRWRDGLSEEMNFVDAREILFPDPLRKFAELLINPTYVPGEPCRAAAPLLKDILDVALGRVDGGIEAIERKPRLTVEDLLFPAHGTAQELARGVQSVLDDPITAALNMILGQRGAIECGVDASLGFGIDVINSGVERLERALGELLS